MDWCFGPFRLDLENVCLWEGDQRLTLRPKTFDILVYLVNHAGELVTRDNLLEVVWPDTVVADGVLTTSIGELRQALGETAREPQYIATVHRRGYRWVAPVTPIGLAEVTPLTPDAVEVSHRAAPSPHLYGITTSSPQLIEREGELHQLHQWFAAACQDQRQIVFLAGEAGIGKTVLLDAFLDQMDTAMHPRVGRGQCIDHYGAGEAYLPLLEALGQVAAGSDRTGVIEVLRQYAPSWLLQLPGLLAPEAWEQLQQRSLGASRERMLRELAEAVEVLTTDRPLVLVLDDLHWSDVSTLDWLAYIARRRAPARLLVIGAYRPVDAVTREHPIRAVTQELRVRGQCEELMLSYLSESGVAAYLKQNFGAASLSDDVIHAFYRRTHGNPLFVVSVVHAATRPDQNAKDEAKPASLSVHPEVVLMHIPESLRLLINQQLEQLPAKEREYLESASVVGRDFSTAAVAANLAISEEEVETQYAALTRQGQFLLVRDPETWRDRVSTTHYSFIHDLYHELLYEQIPASRRSRWHRQVGAWLEIEYGPRAREMAGEIAEHFVRGRAYANALPHVQYAGENALRRSAPQEAIRHVTTGFECLNQLPDNAERDRHELRLQLTLAAAWVATNGFSSPEVEQAYGRAQELAQQLGEVSQLFAALYGLFVVHELRADFHDSAKLSEEMLSLAEQQQDRTLLIGAHELKTCTLFHMGQFIQAQEHVSEALRLYNPSDHQALVALYGLDLGFYTLFWSALTLWLLGYPDQSVQRNHQLLNLAQSAPHAFSLGCAHLFATHVYCLRGESHLVREHAENLISLATDHGLSDLLAQGTIMHGWALTQHGQGQVGIAELRQGLENYRATGQEMDRPFFLALLAQAYDREGQPEAGLSVLDEALAVTESMHGYAYDAWLYQMQGDLLQAADLTRDPAARMPEECFQLALTVARRQHAKSLELRATISLSRLWRYQGKCDDAHELLAPIYNEFTEGFDTADLQEAKALLSELKT